MSYFPLYKNLQFKLLHFFTLIGTDDHCFLGATLCDATSQSIRHHNKQSFIKRIDDVKAVSVQYTRAIVSLNSIFVTRYVGLIIILTYIYLFRAVLKFGHWKVNPRSIRIRLRLIC